MKSMRKAFTLIELLTIVAILSILAAMTIGFVEGKKMQAQKVAETAGKNPSQSSITIGNNSFVALDLRSHISDIKVAGKVLDAVDAFEKAHPELKILEWNLERQPGSYIFVHGIWIHHEPVALKLEK